MIILRALLDAFHLWLDRMGFLLGSLCLLGFLCLFLWAFLMLEPAMFPVLM